MRIGVIGAGNIGGAIAANLIADGHAVTVHDAGRGARCGRSSAAGATARRLAGRGRRAERDHLHVAAEPGGHGGGGAAPGSAARRPMRCSSTSRTNAPATVRAVGARLAAAGRHLLEAPLTGGAPGAQARMLVFMVGGERAVYERCRPLLERLGRARLPRRRRSGSATPRSW